MSFFDRLTNLGKGWVSSKTSGRPDRGVAAELDGLDDAAPAATTAPTAPRTATAKAPAVPPAGPDGDDDPAFDEPRERVKKTL